MANTLLLKATEGKNSIFIVKYRTPIEIAAIYIQHITCLPVFQILECFNSSSRNRLRRFNLFWIKRLCDFKGFILVFSCCVGRGVHLELVSSYATTNFIKCLKKLILKKGRPKVIFSDNAEMFQVETKKLIKTKRDE